MSEKKQHEAEASRPEREEPKASQQASGAAGASTVEHGVLVSSPRDRRVVNWMIEQVGAAQVAAAASKLAGARKPYPSNVAKALKLTPPRALALAEASDVKALMAETRRQLKGIFPTRKMP